MSFIRKAGSIFSVKIVLLVTGLFSSILSARLLGAEGRGIYAMTITIAGLGTAFGNLGIHSANTYYISKDKGVLPLAIGNSILLLCFISLCSILYLVFCLLFPEFAPLEKKFLVISSIFIPLQLAVMLQQNIFIAIDRIGKYNLFDMLYGICFLFALFFFSLFYHVSAENVLIIALIIQSTLFFAAFLVLKNISETIQISLNFLKKCLPYGFKSYILCLLAYLSKQAGILMVKRFYDYTEVGLYSLAFSLAEYAYLIVSSINILLFPVLVQFTNHKDKQIYFLKICIVTTGVLLPVVIGGVLLSPILIPMLYGDSFISSVSTFKILLLGILVSMPIHMGSIYFSANNRLVFCSIMYSIDILLNVIFNILLLPNMGIIGTAVSLVFSYFIVSALLIVFFLKDTGKIRLVQMAFYGIGDFIAYRLKLFFKEYQK